MSTTSLLWYFLILLAFVFIQSTVSNPEVHVNPDEILLGLSLSLDVNCSFDSNASSDLADLVSLVLSYSNDSGLTFSELASISAFSPQTVTLVTRDSVQDDGFLTEAGESYIHLRWAHPNARKGGLYQCIAQGINSTGHNFVMTDTAPVTVNEANLNDFSQKIREMENDSIILQEKISQCNSYSQTLREKLTIIENHTMSMENMTSQCNSVVTDLEERIAQLENYTKSLQQNMSTSPCMSNPDFEDTPLSFNNRQYLLSRVPFYDVEVSMLTCQLCGGYLTEINDVLEHQAIQTFLRGFSEIDGVVVAGSDAQSEGNWVFPSTNVTLTYTDWGLGNPKNLTEYNCLWLWYSEWHMSDDVCHYAQRDHYYRYLCEIPRLDI